MACQKFLIRLLETIPGIEQCVDREANFHNFDVHSPLLELPRILGSTLDNTSLPIPNLKILNTQPIKLELPVGNFLKVGIVWAAKTISSTATKHSCKLKYFHSLLDIPGVTFYSLQKRPGVDIQ
ncbi:MAG: hypothetical protein SWX82_27455 [Cyanobacteriota bacterium]|nr:hypothetical protein [Cyanobacteriota bacterium]